MGVSIVTGQTGDLNVTSENMGACNAGIVGRGQYALFGLGVRMTDATTLHVEGGVACLNGRFVWVDGAGADVAIAAGAAGQNRRDLVCIRYARTGSGESLRESAKLVAVKGAPTSGAAKDPSYNAGSVLDGASTVDMPIARVTLAGIAPTAESVAAPLEPLADLRDSVSRRKTQRLGGVTFERRGSRVDVYGAYSVDVGADAWSELEIGTLDADMRPSGDAGRCFPVAVQGTGAACVLEVQTDGTAKFRALGEAAVDGWAFVAGSYSAAS